MSNTKEIKIYYRELLSDKKPHTRSELIIYAKNKNPNADYTEGMLGGALKSLIDNEPEYMQVDRGVYQLVENYLMLQYISVLEEMVNKFHSIPINPFRFVENLTEEDKYKYSLLESCIQNVEQTISVLKEI